MDDGLSVEDQARMERILAELTAAAEDGQLGLTCEAIEDPIDHEAAVALTALAARHFGWIAREDPSALEADPDLAGRMHQAEQELEASVKVLASVAVMDAVRCLKAIVDRQG